MTRIGTTQAHRNLLKTLQSALRAEGQKERLFQAIAERRSEWDRLRASRPKAENIALRPVPPIIQWLAEGSRDEKKLEEWRK
jgi:hypothetical protein